MKLKVLNDFYDSKEKLSRHIGDVFDVTEDRYLDMKENAISQGGISFFVEEVKEKVRKPKKATEEVIEDAEGEV